jgi:hypothetical protein
MILAKIKKLWNDLVNGIRSFTIFPQPQPSYEDQFGTDEELLAEDMKKVQDDINHKH